MSPSERAAHIRQATARYNDAARRLNEAIRDLAKLGVQVTFRRR